MVQNEVATSLSLTFYWKSSESLPLLPPPRRVQTEKPQTFSLSHSHVLPGKLYFSSTQGWPCRKVKSSATREGLWSLTCYCQGYSPTCSLKPFHHLSSGWKAFNHPAAYMKDSLGFKAGNSMFWEWSVISLHSFLWGLFYMSSKNILLDSHQNYIDGTGLGAWFRLQNPPPAQFLCPHWDYPPLNN